MNVAQAKLSGYLADLVLSVKRNDLEATKSIVDQINSIQVLTSEFDFQTILSPNTFYNDSAVYAVTNLNNIGRRNDMLFIQKIKRLYAAGDSDKVLEFLAEINNIEYLSQLELYLVSRLYQLCIDFELWDELSTLRESFNAIEEKGE